VTIRVDLSRASTIGPAHSFLEQHPHAIAAVGVTIVVVKSSPERKEQARIINTNHQTHTEDMSVNDEEDNPSQIMLGSLLE
jgi:hypothetical protein